MQKFKKIRVLQLGSPTGLYGAERWILALVKYLPRDEIESTVSVIKDDRKLKPELCEYASLLGIETHIFESYGKFSYTAIFQLREFIKENKIKILHTHGYKTDIIGLMAVQGTGCKIISTPHGWAVNSGYKLYIYEFLDRLAFLFFDAIIPLSKELYANIKKIPGCKNKVILIQNGVDIDEIENDTSFPLVEEINTWKKKNYYIIGYIGRLTPGKDIMTLLKAFSKLDLTKTRLALVGDGEQLQELNEIVAVMGLSNCVRFFGFQKNRIEFLRGFDVFVLPSRSEGIPRCLMEAMAAGVPIIATDIEGCRTLIKDNITGMLFQVGDYNSLAEKIVKLVKDEHLRVSFSAAGKAFIKINYSAEKMAAQYSELYKALAE